MEFKLKDGSGTGISAKVNKDQRLETTSIITTDYELGSLIGDAFNINTRFVDFTGNTEQAALYVKNNEDSDLLIQGWFIGVESVGGTPTGNPIFSAYFNATGGTIIDTADQIPIVNRNAGSSEVFDLEAYRGFSGATFTGQDPEPVLFQFQNTGRTFGNVFLVIPKGSSILITVDPNTNGTITLYTGFTGYKLRNNN